jgi:AhpD family alkylhydroperoxidase
VSEDPCLTQKLFLNFEEEGKNVMATVKLIEYEEAGPEVRAVYDDIMATRQIDWVNNFWKALAVQPDLLRRTWEGVKEVMAPGALDPLVKEMFYVAVSVTNGCKYCINSHTAAARKKGMTDEMLAELMAVVGMANQTNALVNGFQVELDDAFKDGGRPS